MIKKSEPNEEQKEKVHNFWDAGSCGTHAARAEKHTLEYYEEIEAFRYFQEPFIHEFAQFSRYRGKKVVEIGYGAGTDFTQWLRVGAKATGLDLTNEAYENLKKRIEVYDLPEPEEIRVGDAENLPFEENTFDLGYSFGVLHHSPNTEKAIEELLKVIKPGGEIKIMVYNRRSMMAIKTWVKHAFCKGRPWKGLGWAMWNHVESSGTKGYTGNELAQIFTKLPVEEITIHNYVTNADYMAFSAFKPLNLLMRAIIACAGYRRPWRRENYMFSDPKQRENIARSRSEVVYTGSPLGFFTCLSARKKH